MVFEKLKVSPLTRATASWANSVVDGLEQCYWLGKRGDPDYPFNLFYGLYGYFYYDLLVQGKKVIKDGDPINIYDILEPAREKVTYAIDQSLLTQYMRDVREKVLKLSMDEYGRVGVIIAEPIDEYGNVKTVPYEPLLRKVVREEIINALYGIGAVNVDILATETSVADEVNTGTASPPVTVVTPTPGKRIDTRSCYLATSSSSGEVWVKFKNTGKLIGKIYADKFKAIALDSIRITGEVDEPLILEWSGLDTGAKIFYVIKYKEVT